MSFLPHEFESYTKALSEIVWADAEIVRAVVQRGWKGRFNARFDARQKNVSDDSGHGRSVRVSLWHFDASALVYAAREFGVITQELRSKIVTLMTEPVTECERNKMIAALMCRYFHWKGKKNDEYFRWRRNFFERRKCGYGRTVQSCTYVRKYWQGDSGSC
jgi:hypothetical protein